MSTATKAESPQETLRDRKRGLYREAILDAAERVFGEVGYDATKVQRIAAEAGVSLTTLYSVLDSKWEIYRAVYRRRLTELMTLAADIAGQGMSPIETLVFGIRMHLGYLMEHRGYLKMLLKEGNAWATIELLRSPEEITALHAGLRLLADAFRKGIEQGVWVDDDPELMARTTIAMQQVRLALWSERGMKEPPNEVIRSVVRQLLRSYCRSEHLQEVLAAHGLEESA